MEKEENNIVPINEELNEFKILRCQFVTLNENGRGLHRELYKNLNDKDSLREVQKYIKNINEIRGFDKQEVTKTMLLLTEEVGELAKAIRKNATDMKVDIEKQFNYDTIESEIADVFYVLSCICNKLNIDIFDCLKEKEAKNINRTWN